MRDADRGGVAAVLGNVSHPCVRLRTGVVSCFANGVWRDDDGLRGAVSLTSPDQMQRDCGLTAAGELRCVRPVGEMGGVWRRIDSGHRQMCGVRADGVVRCWGVVGNASDVGSGAVEVALGRDFVCVLPEGGRRVRCTGARAGHR